MSTVHLSDYRRSLTANAVKHRAPVSCTFEITPTCNLRCHFCYVALDPYKGPYLSTAQIGTIFDRLEDAGVLFLTLTGGEIFSRRDFREIYLDARRRGFLVTLYSNATLVTEAIAELLVEHPPHAMEVSIYGADAEHYEATTGIPGSFARFERGMTRLLGAGVRPLMKHPVSTLTSDHVPAIRAWCESRGLRHKFAAEIENRHDGNTTPSLYRLEPRRVVALKRELNGARRNGPNRAEMPLAECAVGLDEPGAQDRLYQCGAGRVSFFVDALGQASHCVLDREPAFSLLELSWKEVWEGIGAWVNQPLPQEAPCHGCSLRSGCNNCPARARMATGSPYLKDAYQCDVTHVAHGLAPARHHDVAVRPVGACAR